MMKVLLTSADICNTSIHHALEELVGKPIAESGALCIPTAAYAYPNGAAMSRTCSRMGGANTINQHVAAAGLLDELWLHIAPVTIGSGACLFGNVPNLQLEPLEISGTSLVTHIRYRVTLRTE